MNLFNAFSYQNYRVVLYFHAAVRVFPLLRGAGENRELLVPSHHSIMPVLFVGQYLGLFILSSTSFIFADFTIKTTHDGKVSKEK